MKNIRLVIEYDGTNYHGWQSQSNVVSVQSIVSQSIAKITNEKIRLNGASRTDVGVHATGQVANFTTDSSIPGDRFSFALNRVLPRDIIIKSSEEVNLEFHSRFDSIGKRYRYLIYNQFMPSAILRNRAYHVPKVIDEDAMERASKFMVGKHDFSSFRSSECSASCSVRCISSIQIERKSELIEIEIVGNGFLHNMVRIMVGTLIEAGTGKITPERIKEIIIAKNRNLAGKTVSAHGLYLVEVYYKNLLSPSTK